MTEHKLKLLPMYYDAVSNGLKKFELRKDDRNFGVGDSLMLEEWNPAIGDRGRYTGRRMELIICYILRLNDLPENFPHDWCILGLKFPRELP